MSNENKDKAETIAALFSKAVRETVNELVANKLDGEFTSFQWDGMKVLFSGPVPLGNKSFNLRDEIMEVIEDNPEGKKIEALALADDLRQLALDIDNFYSKKGD